MPTVIKSTQAARRAQFRQAGRETKDPGSAELFGFLGLEPLLVAPSQAPPRGHPPRLWCAEHDPWIDGITQSMEELLILPKPFTQEDNKRFLIGRHVETMARWVAETLLDARIIAQNLAIHDPSSDEPRRTIGELDLVYQLPDAPTIRHRELAAKWYLFDPDCPTPADAEPSLEWASGWWGPKRHDRMDLKLTRMRDHQLTLGHHRATRALLREQAPQLHELWLNGQLFWPLHHRIPPSPRNSTLNFNPMAISGHWARLTQWCQTAWLHPKNGNWFRLDKREWLKSRHTPTGTTPCLPDREQPWESPALVALCQECDEDQSWAEVMRLFIVPDDWGKVE